MPVLLELPVLGSCQFLELAFCIYLNAVFCYCFLIEVDGFLFFCRFQITFINQFAIDQTMAKQKRVDATTSASMLQLLRLNLRVWSATLRDLFAIGESLQCQFVENLQWQLLSFFCNC